MHDPSTLAFRIEIPWFGRDCFGKRNRLTIANIWHEDPETDGTDDSCGWFIRGRHLPAEAKALAQEMAEWEEKFPYYFKRPSSVRNPEYQYREIGPGDAAALVLAVWQNASWRLFKCRRLTTKDMLAAMLDGAQPHDNFQSSFARQSEHGEWSAVRMLEHRRGVFLAVIASFYRHRRRWWQHPRWHVWHWSVQIPALQSFQRWAFSRCCWCSGRFGWGESVIGYDWHGKGPRWFRSEPRIAHHRCDSKRHTDVRMGIESVPQ
jgi:hypothetical protein